MTNTLTISREQANRYEQLLRPSANPPIICNGSYDEWEDQSRIAADELRALLAAPAVERQEPVAWMFRWDYDHGNGWCRNAVRFVENMEHVEHEDKSTWRDITPLYTSPPAPVAVPDGWKLVPDKLTDAMCAAAGKCESDTMYDKCTYWGVVTDEMWEAMLAAVPDCLDKVKEMNR